MTTTISKSLAAASPATLAVIRGIDDAQLQTPTPCTEYTVRDLLNHMFQVVVNFQALAARQPADFSSTPDRVTAGWRDRFAEETARLIEAWSDPAALEGTSPMMGMPQPVVGGMVLLDLTVHGWDLARATGQEFSPDPAVVSELLVLGEQLAPQARQMKVFGEPVSVPSDAAEFDRLLGITGRDPGWSPASASV